MWLNYRETERYDILNWIRSITIHTTVIMHWFIWSICSRNDCKRSVFISENTRADSERAASHPIMKNEAQKNSLDGGKVKVEVEVQEL